MMALLLLAVGVAAKDCLSNCGGCTSGRCDVFGCSGSLYCCTDLLHMYGWCCTSCGTSPPTSPPTLSPTPIPSTCLNIPAQTGCDFYQNCIQNYHPCAVITDVAQPKCKEFQQLEPSLFPSGGAWSQYVRSCVQQKIADKVLKTQGTQFTCDQIQDTFFDVHYDCYVAEQSYAKYGFCSLSLFDQIKIMRHTGGLFRKGYWQALGPGVKLVLTCIALTPQGNLGRTFHGKQGEISSNDDDFPEAQVRALLKSTALSIDWDVEFIVDNQTTSSAILYMVYQVKNYSGPTTRFPAVNISHEGLASAILHSVVANATGNQWELLSYNGQRCPVDLSLATGDYSFDLGVLRKKEDYTTTTEDHTAYILNFCGQTMDPLCQAAGGLFCSRSTNGSITVLARYQPYVTTEPRAQPIDKEKGLSLVYSNGDPCTVAGSRVTREVRINVRCSSSSPSTFKIEINPDKCLYTIELLSESVC